MKEVKFRGKRVDNGEWIQGYLSFIYVNGKNEDGFIFSDKAQIYCQNEVKNYDVLTETIGQYTGIKDCCGTEIFEGMNCKIWIEGILQNGLYHVEDMRELYHEMNDSDRYYRITCIEVVEKE